MPDVMLVETVTIINRRGLHARAAAKLVKCASAFRAEIAVAHGENIVLATSIMGLMMLAATRGTELEISASGDDAESAMKALVQLVSNRFDEDE